MHPHAKRALASSHHVGVVHRDVKPSNVFDHINGDGTHTVKMLDFGISKARGHEEFEHTLTTSRDGMLGSPPYMSPEHIRDARTVDHRTDIWSLGVVAYQLLAGRLPFDGQSVGEVFCSVLERRFAPLSTVRPELPPDIEALIDRCLSRDPAERFQTAADLARAIAAHASPEVAKLVDSMPTTVPAPSSAPSVVTRSATPISGRRLDGEVHTLTLPPAGSAHHGETNQTVVGSRDDSDIDIPPSRPFDVMSLPIPFDDLSPESVERAKKIKRASRRAVGLAVGAGALVLGLIAVPFAMSRHSSAAPSGPHEGVIEPATAIVAATPLPNSAPGVSAPAKDGTNEVTFDVQDGAKKAQSGGGTAARPPSRSPARPTKATGASKSAARESAAAAAHAPSERVDPPAAAPAPEAPAPKPKADRPELHPNPYNF